MARRIIVGISGASGAVYGVRLLQVLSVYSEIETHLVISSAGKVNIELETDFQLSDVTAMADRVYEEDQMESALASGSFLTEAMVIAPCSIKTLSGIANSYSSNLMVRAADVCLKEKRTLVLVVRETPLHKGHLRLMTDAADLGAHILPPMPSFYHRPRTIDDLVDQTIGKILDALGIDHQLFARWGESAPD